jgi:hypothetical protein
MATTADDRPAAAFRAACRLIDRGAHPDAAAVYAQFYELGPAAPAAPEGAAIMVQLVAEEVQGDPGGHALIRRVADDVLAVAGLAPLVR